MSKPLRVPVAGGGGGPAGPLVGWVSPASGLPPCLPWGWGPPAGGLGVPLPWLLFRFSEAHATRQRGMIIVARIQSILYGLTTCVCNPLVLRGSDW